MLLDEFVFSLAPLAIFLPGLRRAYGSKLSRCDLERGGRAVLTVRHFSTGMLGM